jgi:hypothetical protein
MANPVIIAADPDLTSVCNSFPELMGVQIPRQNLISLIARTLAGGIEVLTVEGSEGIGKTTLLKQFASAHCTQSFSLFVRPTSRFAYDSEILLRDLYNQMHYAVTGRELPLEQGLDDGLFRRLLIKLQQRARLKHTCFYFVLDGLETIPKESLAMRDALLSMLPFGFSNFRFILSGDGTEMLRGRRLAHKPLLLPYFNFDESLSFFSDVSASRELVEALFRTYDGFPVILASAKRILQSGVSANQLLDEIRKSALNLFELEWGAVSSSNKAILEMLALLAHDPTKHAVSDLAYIFEIPVDSVTAMLSPLKFLRVPDDAKDGIEFISDAFRIFASDKLRDFTYTPHAQHFRELATPLPRIPDHARVKALVGTFDAQKAAIERLGPSEDFVRLQLILAHAESMYDFNLAKARIIETYFYVNQRSDLTLKTACMAFIVAQLHEIDPEKKLEASDGLHSMTQKELQEDLDKILEVTADHTLARS